MCSPANPVSREIKKEKELGLVIRGFTPLPPNSVCTHAEARPELDEGSLIAGEDAHFTAARPEQAYSRA